MTWQWTVVQAGDLQARCGISYPSLEESMPRFVWPPACQPGHLERDEAWPGTSVSSLALLCPSQVSACPFLHGLQYGNKTKTFYMSQVNTIKALKRGQTLAIKALCVGQWGPHEELQCVFDEDRQSRSPTTYWKSPRFVLAAVLTCAFFVPVEEVLLSINLKILQQ